jgi:hypothetical protein
VAGLIRLASPNGAQHHVSYRQCLFYCHWVVTVDIVTISGAIGGLKNGAWEVLLRRGTR